MRYPLKYILLILVLPLSAASATTINVPADYSTIQAALTAADSSDTVLVQPGTYYENIFWPDVNGIKLISAGDSSNTVIDGGANGSVIYMNPSTATIDSTTEIRGFKITNGGNIANGGGMFVSNASPELTRLWVTSNTATYGGGLYISGSSPTLTYVTVSGNTASYGGGLYISGGNPALTNVTLTSNTAGSSGGGLCISGGSPTLTDVTVTGNMAGNYGGGLYIVDSYPTLTHVTVTGNTSSYHGGGLYISGGSPTLTHVTAIGNTASSYGGGIFIYNSSATLTDVTVISNTAYISGGGLCIWGSSLTLTDVTVSGNTASYHGGGLFIDSGSPMLTHVTVTGNTATEYESKGGGLYIYSSSPTLTDVTVSGNTAGSGGGLYIDSGSPMLTHVTVTGNTANDGGGLYISGGSLTLTDVTVSDNAAARGGGLYTSSGSPALTRVTVSRNLGEGLFFRNGSGALVNVTITGNTRGIYVESGTPTIAGSNIAYHGTGLYNADNTNIVDADSIWWGNSSGPYHSLQNPGGLGDSVNTFVDITPFLTEPDTAAPPIPIQNLVVTNQGDDFIELAWDASPIGDLAGYRIYLNTDSTGFPYADTIDVGNTTSATLSNLEPGLAYYIAATCYDTDGNESWYSQEVNAPPFNSPPAEFALLAPTADTIMVRSGEAIWDSVIFNWEPALDPDVDSVSYHFEPEGDFAWLFPVIDTNATTISLVPQIAVVAKGMGGDTLVLTWNVAATDGLNSTWSANGPRTLSLMIDYPSATEDLPLIPQSYALHPAYPNPFNPATTLRYDLPEATEVVLTVYDLMGREVAHLVDRDMTAGYHQVVWEGRDARGRAVPTGIYIIRLLAPDYTHSIKLVLLK